MANINTIASDVSYGLGFLSSFGQLVDVVGIYSNTAGNSNNTSPSISSSIVDSLIGASPTQAAFGQMFANARPLKAHIRETSRVMDHPVETGVVISDHHIINPVEIDIPMLVTAEFYAATYSQIRQAFISATPLSVKTRVGVYADMIIQDMPHEEDAEMYDVITIGLHLKQVIYVVPGGGTLINFQPADPLNSNTIISGLQQAVSVGGSLLTAGTAIASYANLSKIL